MLKVHEQFDLTPYTSFGVKASADYFIEFTESTSLRTFLIDPPHFFKNPFVLGGGSNILFTGHYAGCILHPASKGIRITVEDSNSVVVEVQAGEEWDVFVQWAISHNLGGVENLTYIPGRVGACPVQNIGAYGAEVQESIMSVETIDIQTGIISHLSNKECKFGYRDSIFKNELKGQRIILSVLFRLQKNPTLKTQYGQVAEHLDGYKVKNLATLSRTIRNIRQAKLPEPWEIGNAGSFFKNPIVEKLFAEGLKKEHPDIPVYPVDEEHSKLAAGWLIDQAGWKGKSHGNTGVHDKQALVLVNNGDATAEEILALADEIKKSVQEKFGVLLHPEVNII